MTTTKTRRDIHQEVTNAIIAAIEAGPGSFELPWHRSSAGLGRPRNAATRRAYNGVNILTLWISAQSRGFTSGSWGTYKQWQSLGAQVRRGEKASTVVFYKSFDVRTENEDGEPVTETRLFARSSRVFNADQVDGFSDPTVTAPLTDDTETLAAVDDFIAATGAEIRHGGACACYAPSGDYIRIPPRAAFTGTATSTATESYYATVLHEIVHWAGHPARCNRDLSGRFGNAAYAMEELVADLGAAFLCADLHIAPSPRADHAAYLASWLKVLRNDKKAIFTAASKASQAADYLAGLQAAAAAA